MRNLLVLFLLCVTCACAARGTTETRVRSSLDVLAEVVDPAYRFAMDACKAEESDAARRFTTGADPKGRDDYFAIKDRCHDLRDAFNAIRHAHERAVKWVEDGAIADAEAELERVRNLWRALGASGGVTP